MFWKPFILFIVLICGTSNFAQDSLVETYSKHTKVLILSLSELIDSAIIHSPTIKHYDALLASAEYDYKATRKDWAKEFSFSFETKYGEYGSSFALDDLSLGYGGVIGVNVPLSLFIGRGSRLNSKAEQVLATSYKREEMIQDLTLTIIDLYKELMVKETKFLINSEAMINSQLNYDYAKLEFNEGKITIDAYVKVHDYYTGTKVDYEQSKADYWSSLIILEKIVGVNITANDFNKIHTASS